MTNSELSRKIVSVWHKSELYETYFISLWGEIFMDTLPPFPLPPLRNSRDRDYAGLG